MNSALLILIVEALLVYTLVLWAHSLRHRFGLIHFYALMGCVTAVMSWTTDAGLRVILENGLTFNIGSTIFYTSLLLGVFGIYVFDGPGPTRVLISTVIGISALVPLIALVLHFQSALITGTALGGVPTPSLRINSASIFTTLVDLVFLAIVWEMLGQPALRVALWGRTFFTLLGVMWLDVLLFSTLAFAGTEHYRGILTGSLISRFFVSVVAFPLLYFYIRVESRRKDIAIENRPVLAILREIADIKVQLTSAQDEISRRKEAEAALQKALSEVKTLRGMLPICAHCKRIRDDQGSWQQIELYVRSHSDAEFSHGICPACLQDFERRHNL